MTKSTSVVVLLGTPHSGIEAQAQRLAQSGNGVDRGVYLGDLQLSLVDRVKQLPELYALAQTPQHEPLFAALSRYLPAAAENPAAFLALHANWSIAELLEALLGAIDTPLVTMTDLSAGFRIHQIERWFARLPRAVYVHVTTPLAPFVEAATAHYKGRLFTPPDYRDHNVFNAAPVLKPELAWYQIHAALARAFSDARDLSRIRVDIAELAGLDADALLARATTTSERFNWPYARQELRAMAPTLPQLEASIGYRGS
ncbi:MAG: hypothetical protein JWQ90_2228 [Hydrocarboniphaga sp.]|uniref:hypothetical protein n=1 Tax=Hydrocarboniphaga sp. TaxID=2033016 RepID=UPI00262DC262|nr:hypothetical protein [Hydrocarboniphaga sp.]MDB5969778.1 hypothetical protein [Hydrocarboniphaga sp.]